MKSIKISNLECPIIDRFFDGTDHIFKILYRNQIKFICEYHEFEEFYESGNLKWKTIILFGKYKVYEIIEDINFPKYFKITEIFENKLLERYVNKIFISEFEKFYQISVKKR